MAETLDNSLTNIFHRSRSSVDSTLGSHPSSPNLATLHFTSIIFILPPPSIPSLLPDSDLNVNDSIVRGARNLSTGKNGTEYFVRLTVGKESKISMNARGFNPEWNETFRFTVDASNADSIISVHVEIFRKTFALWKSVVAETTLQVPIFLGEVHEEDISMIGVEGNEPCSLSIAMELRINSQQVSFEVGDSVFELELLDHRWLPQNSESSFLAVPTMNGDNLPPPSCNDEEDPPDSLYDLDRNPSLSIESEDSDRIYDYNNRSSGDFATDCDQFSEEDEDFDLEELRLLQEKELKCGKCGIIIIDTKMLCVLECDHRFCCFCINQHASTNSLEQNQTKELTCLEKDCRFTLPHWALRRSISENDFESYLSWSFSSIVKQDDHFFSCPKCSVVVERAEPVNSSAAPKEEEINGRKISIEALKHKEEFRFRCRECSTEFCSSCDQSPYHIGFTCLSYKQYLSSRRCRFCQQTLPSSPSSSSSSSSSSSPPPSATDRRNPQAFKEVCSSPECLQKSQHSCQKIMSCGHCCSGIANEAECIGCLNPSCLSDASAVSGEDFCNICWIDGLSAAPAIRLKCQHVFHFMCAKKKIEEGWPSARVTFSFWSCPLCKQKMSHPALDPIIEPFNSLYEEICSKSLKRLEYEGLNQSEDIVKPQGPFFNNRLGYAMHRFAYYQCFKCLKPYFGGQVRCDAGDGGREFNKEELVCASCSGPDQLSCCPKHGVDFLEHKCQFCCSTASWYCWGKTHFCDSCHKRQNEGDYVSKYSTDLLPKCSGPAQCPLKISHPPNGTPFSLGCALCRDSNDF